MDAERAAAAFGEDVEVAAGLGGFDDAEGVVLHRLEDFQKYSAPIIDYYKGPAYHLVEADRARQDDQRQLTGRRRLDHGRRELVEVAAEMKDDKARAEVAFVLAAAIAFADNAIADEENETLNTFAEGLGIDEGRANQLLDEVEADMGKEQPASG